jgi:membrane-bound serine protease (ClpP class)
MSAVRVAARQVAFPALILLVAVALVVAARPARVSAASPASLTILLLRVDGAIDPVNAQYVSRGLDQAQRDRDAAVLIELNTPGGLDSSMREITGAMLASPIPIVVYVTPDGARAGSAGVFITLAADVAAMAPGTNIGAAHPVDLGGGDASNLPNDERDKVTNDAAAYARMLATTRHHNADWADSAVRQSVALTADEAVAQHVVDLVSPSQDQLLVAIDGRTVTRGNQVLSLRTRDAVVVPFELTSPEQLLHLIDDPNIAYLLLTIGFWAIIAELFHPGTLLPGIAGLLCLALGLTALQSLPLNWTGLVLIVAALGLFVVDLKAPSHGALTAAGLVTFVVGSLMLFAPGTGAIPPDLLSPYALTVNPVLVALIAVGLAAFFAVAIRASLRARRRPPMALYPVDPGGVGVATSDLAPVGSVHIAGEEWRASTANGPIRRGESVVVVRRDGLRLIVRPRGEG